MGIGSRAIAHRLERRRLHGLYRGVYAVGHRKLTSRGRYMAAVLDSGPGAVSSHRSAADLWEIRRTSRASIEVTVPYSRRPRTGIQLHQLALSPDECTVADGIPITSVPRTLLDLAAVLDAAPLERAIERAEALRLWDPVSLPELLDRHPRRHGVSGLRAILAAGRFASVVTRSEL